MQPTTQNNIIAQSIQRRGEGLYALSFVTDDLEVTLNTLKDAGVRITFRGIILKRVFSLHMLTPRIHLA